MSNRTFHPPRAIAPETVLLAGNFDTNGASSPASPVGKGYTVARTGTGTYTVTLTDNYPQLLAAEVSAQCNTAAGFQVEFGAISLPNTAGPTLVIRTLVAGAAADVAANANNRVHFRLALCNSSFA